MQKKVAILILFLSLPCLLASAEAGEFLSLRLYPGYQIPLGGKAQTVGNGSTVVFSTDFRVPPLPYLSIRTDLTYSYVPILSAADDVIHTLSAGGGIALHYPLFWKLSGSLYGTAGIYYPVVTDESVPRYLNAYAAGGLNIKLAATASLGFYLDASYRKYFDFVNTLAFSTGASFTPIRLKPLELHNIELNDIFPILYKYYDDHPMGKVVVTNQGSVPVTDVEVSFYVEKYMDNPKQCVVLRTLPGGAESEIDLFALFSSEIFEITENTKVSAKLMYTYTREGKRLEGEDSITMKIYNRNAVSWDDDRKAAAFVTAKDPSVLAMAKNVSSWIRQNRPTALDKNLLTAIGIHEALRVYGISYVIDPNTPYEEYSQNRHAVDFLQFPSQTFKYKAGDCDDLSILYSALFESVGIETAFITTPGHIYIAFSLDTPAETAKIDYVSSSDFLFQEDKAWIPLEVTQVQQDFIDAWETGAKEWRNHISKNQAGFHPVRRGWSEYAPAAYSGGEGDLSLPPEDEVVKAYSLVTNRIVKREIDSKMAALEQRIEKSGPLPKYINKLGVVYARYGLLEQAKQQFRRISQEYVPAMINLGNIHFLEHEYREALIYYDQAVRKEPDNPKIKILIAKTHFELEDFETADEVFTEVKTKDPGLAAQFAYLGRQGASTIRADEAAAVMEEILWAEEPE